MLCGILNIAKLYFATWHPLCWSRQIKPFIECKSNIISGVLICRHTLSSSYWRDFVAADDCNASWATRRSYQKRPSCLAFETHWLASVSIFLNDFCFQPTKYKQFCITQQKTLGKKQNLSILVVTTSCVCMWHTSTKVISSCSLSNKSVKWQWCVNGALVL